MSDSRPASFAEFARVVQGIKGRVAWRSRAGSGTGSIFTLRLGTPLASNEEADEYGLMVYCAWRIVEAERVLCSWHEDAAAVLAPALRQLEEAEVVSATLSPWGDLTISFAHGRSLHIWNDAPFDEDDTCWWLGSKEQGYYGVENRNKFRFEPGQQRVA